MDISSVKIVGSHRRVWGKAVFDPHSELNSFFPGRIVASQLELTEYDCKNDAFRVTAMTLNFEDGGAVTVEPYRIAQNSWAPIPPDSMVDSSARFICAWKPK